MRAVQLSVVLSIAACGTSYARSEATTDGDASRSTDIADAADDVAAEPDAMADATSDASADAAPCVPTTLLTGGMKVEPQGWSVTMQPPASLTYGPDYVRLETSTVTGEPSGGQLLLNYPGAIETGKPFKVRVVMLVETVHVHNQFDSAAVIMGSYTPPFGSNDERAQMIYLDSASLGWADDSQMFASRVANNTYHTYELSVDAANVARVTVDGVAALTRNAFVFNGAIAVGDQTNDVDVDSTLRIRSVTRLCP